MSATEEREIEVVTGTIEGVIQKKPDTWQVEVRPDGSQYTKKLWTKDAELVSSLSAKLGQAGAFVCSASYWTNNSGTQVRSLWINAEGAEAVASAPQSAPAPTNNLRQEFAPAKAQNRSYAPDLKDRMIVRQTALKAAAEIVAPRAGSSIDPNYDPALEVMKAAQRFETWVYRDIDVPETLSPALSAHDDAIPY